MRGNRVRRRKRGGETGFEDGEGKVFMGGSGVDGGIEEEINRALVDIHEGSVEEHVGFRREGPTRRIPSKYIQVRKHLLICIHTHIPNNQPTTRASERAWRFQQLIKNN